MQLVDVLRDEGMELVSFLQLDDGQVPGVRLRGPGRARHAVLPGELPHLGVREVVVDVGHLFCERILGPQALRAAEVRDAGVGGDAGAGQDDDAPGGVNPGTRVLDEPRRQGIWILPPPGPPIGGSGPCGTTIEEAAWRRSSCSSFTVRSIASFASWPNFSAASSSEPAPISKAIGSAPAGVSTCVSPT